MHTNWLAWDDFLNPPTTRYRLLIGWASRVYTMTNDAGTNKTIQVIWPTDRASYYNVIAYTSNDVSNTNGEVRLPRPPRTDTNILIVAKGTNLRTAPILSGPWSGTGATIITLTNPTGTMFIRGDGKVSIVKTNF